MAERLPIVGLPCDYRIVNGHPTDTVGEKYIAAVRDGSRALPLLVPSLDPPLEPAEILAAVDGLMFTGAPSNVAPHHYGGPAPRDGNLADPNRDATTLPLLRAAIAAGVPTLCICRGLQELNVALGGTLFQHVAEEPGRFNHSAMHKPTIEDRYGPAHKVEVVSGGMLAQIFRERIFVINSLHGQAIDRLAPGLFAEAYAEDGTVEAVSLPGAKGFVLAVQWHPEWRWWENAQSRALFGAFGAVLRGNAWQRPAA